jgi:DNA modification methylase
MSAPSFPAPSYDQLDRVDWTFADAYTRGGPHGAHPYPAKFIPQIPRTLIAALHPGDSSAVLDPFCGSGTTLVEAALAGIPAIGIDLNPLACLISKVKVTPLRYDLVDAAAASVSRTTRQYRAVPEIPAVDHWFDPEIQRSLASLVGAIDDEADPDTRDALRVALSSIIVRVSRQESDTRYAAIDKRVSESDVVRGFLQAAKNISIALETTWNSLFPPAFVRIINQDILAVNGADVMRPVSVVVTSPPYPNAYEYWLYHKYRMFWLGMDPVGVREKEIGARPHYHRRNPQTAADFERQMSSVFRLLHEVVVPGGHACFQVGSSVIRGEHIDNAALLQRAAGSAGFSTVRIFAREIPKTRKAFNLAHARINSESILIFRREPND